MTTVPNMTTLTHEEIRLYTLDEAAELLGVRRSWLRDQVTADAVPHVRLGKVKGIRFTPDDLVEIIESRRQRPGGRRPAEVASEAAPQEDPLAGFEHLRSTALR